MGFPRETGTQHDSFPARPLRALPLVAAKLHPPPIHSRFISRPRLVAQLQKSRQCKLTLLSAPGGYGKTTLLSAWASQCRLPVLWISLDESDNDPMHFWSYFARALSTLSAWNDEKILELLSFDGVEALLTGIIGCVATIPQEFIVILDDYHTIENQQIHLTLAALLEYLPAHMHICIASRTRPPLPLPRLRASQQLYDVRASDLLFTLEEIMAFFAHVMEQELLSEQALLLKTRTGGWIAILHLVAIWLQEQKEGWKILEDGWKILEEHFSNHRYISEYLAEEILQRQSQAMQAFLLQTSLLGQFNSELCAAVTERSDARHLLAQIEQANLFLIPLDVQHHWYAYHELFRTFLLQRLEQTSPDLLPRLHGRACAWYEQHEMFTEAITHALAIVDLEKAAEIILKNGEKLLIRGEAGTLLGWLRKVPEEFVRLYPLLCLFYACSLMMVGKFDLATIWLANVEYLKKRTSVIPAPQQQPLKEERAEYIRSLTTVLRAHIAIFWGDISYVANLTFQIEETLAWQNTLVHSLNLLNIGIVQWLNKDVVAAEETFVAAAACGEYLKNSYIILAAGSGLMVTHMMQGKRRQALAIARQALQQIAEHKSYLSPFSIYLYTETSYLLYEWNKLEEAAYYAQEAITYGEKHSYDILLYGYTILSQIRLAQRRESEAQDLLRRAEQCLQRSQQRPWVLSRLAEQAVRLALARNNLAATQRWSSLPSLTQFGALAIILPMRVALAKNQPEEVLRLAQMPVPGEVAASEDPVRNILQARAYIRTGKTPEALQAMDRALREAAPESYIRFFLDEGPECRQVLQYQLQSYERQTTQSEDSTAELSWLIAYVRLLLAEFEKEQLEPAAIMEQCVRPVSSARLPEELSERERDVLRYIVAGYSNQQIAQKIYIAESTVKWHVKHIYSKLHVHNRAQAIVEAQRQQIV